MIRFTLFLIAGLLTFGHVNTASAADEKPLKALLITGGCCHNYPFQAQQLTNAVAKLAPAEWTIVNEGGNGTRAEIALYNNPDWAQDFDVVVHNECFADTTNEVYIQKITSAHKAGVPGVVIHCAMHTYRSAKIDDWREFLGVTSKRHDHQSKYPVKLVEPVHPILKGVATDWVTPMDELYVMVPGDYLSKNSKDYGKYVSLNVLGLDGKTKRTVIWQCFNGAVPRIDAKGNIYIADMVKPADRSFPEFFDGRIKPPPAKADTGDGFWYSHIYGSILKFPPSGGIIWHETKLPKSALGQPPAELLAKPKQPFKRHFAYSPHLKGEIQGALWTRFG